MSHTTMFMVDNGRLYEVAEFSNSWGWSPLVWDALLARYRYAFAGLPAHGELMPTSDYWPVLFKEYKTLPLRPWEFNVLCATFDRAIIRGEEQIRLLSDSLRLFDEAHSIYGHACHLKAIADRLQGFVADLCFNGTSVEDTWQTADGRPYDCAVDTRHWYPVLRPLKWTLKWVDPRW